MKLIYILELENNKYYIGKTSRIDKRFNEHLNGKGSRFTKIHKPIKIYKVYKELSEFDEDNYTKKYMKLFGIDNVRGGSYSNINLNDNQINLLNKELNSKDNLCYRCDRNTHNANDCYASININGSHIDNYSIYSIIDNTISVVKSIFRYFKY